MDEESEASGRNGGQAFPYSSTTGQQVPIDNRNNSSSSDRFSINRDIDVNIGQSREQHSLRAHARIRDQVRSVSVEQMADLMTQQADQRLIEDFIQSYLQPQPSQAAMHLARLLFDNRQPQAGQLPQQVIDLSIASSLQHNSNQIRGNYNAQDRLKNSFANQKLTPQQIMEIHSFIKSEKNFNALTSHEGMKVGDKLIFLPEGQDCILFTDFDFTKLTE